MPLIQINFSKKESTIIGIVKAKEGLKTKKEAVKLIVSRYKIGGI